MSRFQIYRGNVAPVVLIPAFDVIHRETGCDFESIYRGDEATGLLHRLGKHSQAELFDGFRRGRPGFLPANRPGTSTHELRSDGRAYPDVPVGGKLRDWQCGFDVPDGQTDEVIHAAAKHGLQVFRPYPTGSEFHHLNFRVRPVVYTGTYEQWAKWVKGGRKGKRPNVNPRVPQEWWNRLTRAR